LVAVSDGSGVSGACTVQPISEGKYSVSTAWMCFSSKVQLIIQILCNQCWTSQRNLTTTSLL